MRELATVRNTLVLVIACVFAALGLVVPAPAAAAGPNVELSKEQPAQGLLGTPQEVTLRASNPKGEERAYNLTFRDVLPKGVKYVGPAHGSDGSTLEPRVLEDAPNEGETTLIFENVADLSGNSHYLLTFKVEATSPEYTVGDTYTDEAGAYVDSAPLAPPTEAKTVRITRRDRLVVDGPFAETKEVLGGYYLIEAESLDAAVEWAKRLRHDGEGSIEVRPLLSISP